MRLTRTTAQLAVAAALAPAAFTGVAQACDGPGTPPSSSSGTSTTSTSATTTMNARRHARRLHRHRL